MSTLEEFCAFLESFGIAVKRQWRGVEVVYFGVFEAYMEAGCLVVVMEVEPYLDEYADWERSMERVPCGTIHELVSLAQSVVGGGK